MCLQTFDLNWINKNVRIDLRRLTQMLSTVWNERNMVFWLVSFLSILFSTDYILIYYKSVYKPCSEAA